MWTGEYPYQESPPANFAAQVAYRGFRPQIPPTCGPLWTNLISSCCTYFHPFFTPLKENLFLLKLGREAADRPSFADILRSLEEIRVYMINEALDEGGMVLAQQQQAGGGGNNLVVLGYPPERQRVAEANDNGYFVLNNAGVLEPTPPLDVQGHRYSSGEGAEDSEIEDY